MSEESVKKSRIRMHEAMEEFIALNPPPEEDPAVLRSWVAIATLSYADGGNQMYMLSSGATGDSELPRWEKTGLLHYALHEWEPDLRESDDD